MSDSNEAITKFCDVTGLDAEHAKVFLDAAKNDLAVALHNFFAVESGAIEAAVNEEVEDIVDDEVLPVEVDKSSKKSSGSGERPNTNRFQTVSSLRDSSSSDDETGQAFYAGGSTHSGQQVLGPPKNRNQIVADMFRSVKEHGGEVVSQEPGSSKSSTFKFSGTGYKLGQTSSDTEVVASGAEPGSGRKEMTITLKLWRQGFSIDGGPLRKYHDPENLRFLNTVSKGVIPDELLRQAQGHEVNLNLEDHGQEDFVQSKPKLAAFSGKGNILGSPVPVVQASSTQTSTAAAVPQQGDRANNEAQARQVIPLNASQPTTSVQIRLADGSRLVGTFNHSHTIANLRTFIATARPEYAGASFLLLTTFPSKELTDDSATLAESGILNAALLQRLK